MGPRLNFRSRKISDFKNRRKNFFPTLVLSIFLWSLLVGLVFYFPPIGNFVIFLFFFLFFWSFFLTGSLIFANSRRGFLLAVFVIAFLFFRYFQIYNPLSIVLLAAILTTIDLYLS